MMLKGCFCAIADIDDIIKMSKTNTSKPKKQQRVPVSNVCIFDSVYSNLI